LLSQQEISMSGRSWWIGVVAAVALFLASIGPAAAREGERCAVRPGFAGGGCGPGLWCEPRAGQCARRSAGTCVRVPQVCTMIYQPVCGCDGRTHGNDCERRARQVGKLRDGPC
jgi:hypothetical protein